jgi:WD40 repeat protein
VFDTTTASAGHLLVRGLVEEQHPPTLIANLTGHTDDSRAVAWSPDGSLLATGSDSSDCSVRIWDFQQDYALVFVLLDDDTKTRINAGISSLDWSPDGTKLLAGHYRNEISLWDMNHGTLLWNIGDLTNRTFGSVVSVAWHPSGEFFAASFWNITLLLNSTNGEELDDSISSHYTSVNDIAWSPTSSGGGSLLAIGSGAMNGIGPKDNSIRIWDRDTQAYIYNLTDAHTQAVDALAWSPNGAYLVSASIDGTCKIWNVATETVVQTLPPVGTTTTHVPFSSVDWNSDGTLIASGSYSRLVQIWDASDGRELARFFSASSGDAIMDVAWHPNMNILAVSTWEAYDSPRRPKIVEIWDVTGVRGTALPESSSPPSTDSPPVSSSPISTTTAPPSSLSPSLVPTEPPFSSAEPSSSSSSMPSLSPSLVPTEPPFSSDATRLGSSSPMPPLPTSAASTPGPTSSASKIFCDCVVLAAVLLVLGISVLVL